MSALTAILEAAAGTIIGVGVLLGALIGSRRRIVAAGQKAMIQRAQEKAGVKGPQSR